MTWCHNLTRKEALNFKASFIQLLSAKGAKCKSLGHRPRFQPLKPIALKARNDLGTAQSLLIPVGAQIFRAFDAEETNLSRSRSRRTGVIATAQEKP